MPKRIASVLLVSALLAGCGSQEEPAGKSISGQVTFQGKPLDQGTIQFVPAAGQGTFSGGPIKDGQYTVPAEKGLEPGLYQVQISSKEGESPPSDELPGEAPPPPTERIPAKYNSRTTLKAEVKEEGENKFDFTIP